MPLSATRPSSPETANSLDLASPKLTRQRRWIDDSRFRMRRIVVLRNQQKEIVGYRPMIQQGAKESRRDYYQTFKPTSEMTLE